MACWDETRAERLRRAGYAHDSIRRRLRQAPGGCRGLLRKVGQVRGPENDRCEVMQCGECLNLIVVDWRGGGLVADVEIARDKKTKEISRCE